ncbi:lytic transglycosylase domain-containing protein [Paraburkholderia sp. DHOC27]|uniref:transglycosylase SLT domain-containing protein n=1 Tax=Paraburkholderia sp. DHOC27 TaxID=2303330 RepID=UPI000E3CBE24|nr:lytic transglycosylase domain-containing protein [Paraburkholderia sp. DHOC27]RFU47653.1 lytic transglycosylase domain-containing protein [Paraburkholderia sp. DHOC27]
MRAAGFPEASSARLALIDERSGVARQLLAAALLAISLQPQCTEATLPAAAFVTPPAFALQIRGSLIREVNFRFGVGSPVPVIAGQIMQESRFSANAVSPAGALGLMQFMPKTAEWAAVAGKLGQAQPLDPLWSLRAGVWYDWYLHDQLKRFDTECDHWHFTLSAYNGGLKYVLERQALASKPGSWTIAGPINPGIKPESQRENVEYSPKILYYFQPAFQSWGIAQCL